MALNGRWRGAEPRVDPWGRDPGVQTPKRQRSVFRQTAEERKLKAIMRLVPPTGRPTARSLRWDNDISTCVHSANVDKE